MHIIQRNIEILKGNRKRTNGTATMLPLRWTKEYWLLPETFSMYAHYSTTVLGIIEMKIQRTEKGG